MKLEKRVQFATFYSLKVRGNTEASGQSRRKFLRDPKRYLYFSTSYALKVEGVKRSSLNTGVIKFL